MTKKKEWYESKTIASAIVILAIAIYQAYTGMAVPVWIYSALAGVGLIGIRQAIGFIR